MSLSLGTTLGRYEIHSLIGAGGMGEVYLARDPKINRDVAIKVLPSAFSEDKERLARFEQEAQAAGALNHPNILSIYDVDSVNGTTYVVSELLEGETLRDMMGNTPMAVRRAINYALQAAHGLAAAHEKGIIHRDLKPENLFVTADGRVKILDFGLAKLIETNGEGISTELPTRKINTSAGAVMGTAGYMSPEQLRGRSVDPRTDIFSFGTVLYEMLSGKKAFQRDSAADTISAILREDPPDLTESNSNVNPGLERVVRRCLEKNREERFHSASDLAFALESLTTVHNFESGTAIMTAESAEHAVPKKSYRNWIIWALAGLFAATLISLVSLYFVWRPAQAQTLRFTIPPPDKFTMGEAPAISPDGRRLAFVVIGTEGTPVLAVRSMDSLENTILSGTDTANFPFWSPDGRSIGFFAGGKLKRVDASGGPVQTLADASGDARGGSWGPDGTIIFTPNVLTPVMKVASTGGAVTEVTRLEEKKLTSHRWPQFLPDGRRFLFYGRGPDMASEGIYAGSLDSAEVKFIVATRMLATYVKDSVGKGHLAFMQEQTLVLQPFDAATLTLSGEPTPLVSGVLGYPSEFGPTAYSAFSFSNDGKLVYKSGGKQISQPGWYDRSGRLLETVLQPGLYHEPSLSPDAKKVVFGKSDDGSQDLWIYDFERKTNTRFTFDPAADVSSTWSQDGATIAFSSNRSGHFSLYRKSANGGGSDEPLLILQNDGFADDFSPDGKYLLFEYNSGAEFKFDIWLLPLTGEAKPQPYIQTPFLESHSQFSPDGKWIAYSSDESGRAEIFVQPFPATGGKWQVSMGGGDQVQWRQDGKELYYISADRKLMAVPINTAGTFEPGQAAPLFQTAVPVTNLTDDRNHFVSTEIGQKFLINTVVDGALAAPLTVVVNWSLEPRR
jgi:serine/threonine protein kinase